MDENTCGIAVVGRICGKPAVDHVLLPDSDLRIYVCADHYDMREGLEQFVNSAGFEHSND